MSLTWRRSGPYQMTAYRGEARTDYAVSRALVLANPDTDAHQLVARYTAWHGPDLLEQPRETSRPARILGVRDTAEAAMALCAAHLQATP